MLPDLELGLPSRRPRWWGRRWTLRCRRPDPGLGVRTTRSTGWWVDRVTMTEHYESSCTITRYFQFLLSVRGSLGHIYESDSNSPVFLPEYPPVHRSGPISESEGSHPPRGRGCHTWGVISHCGRRRKDVVVGVPVTRCRDDDPTPLSHRHR